MDEIADPDAVALDLRGVGGPNPLLRRPDLVAAALLLERAVELLVEVEDEVGTVGDLQASLP